MNDHISILRRFRAQAIILEDKKFNLLDQQRVTFSFFADVKKFNAVNSELPGRDLTRLFLVDFRFFYIKKRNPHNFESVCKFFIESGFKAEEVQKWLDVYKKVFAEESIGVQIDKKQLTTKMIFETILNAETFHQEGSQDGVDLINVSPFIEPIARLKFIVLLSKLRGIICSFNRQIVEVYLRVN